MKNLAASVAKWTVIILISLYISHFLHLHPVLRDTSARDEYLHLDLHIGYAFWQVRKILIQLLCFSDVWAGSRDEFSQGDDKWGRESEHELGWERWSNPTWGANMPGMPADFTDPGLWCPCTPPAPREIHGQAPLSGVCVWQELRVCVSEWITRLPARWATGVKIRCEVYVW